MSLAGRSFTDLASTVHPHPRAASSAGAVSPARCVEPASGGGVPFRLRRAFSLASPPGGESRRSGRGNSLTSVSPRSRLNSEATGRCQAAHRGLNIAVRHGFQPSRRAVARQVDHLSRSALQGSALRSAVAVEVNTNG